MSTSSRYLFNGNIKNNSELYQEVLKNKNLKQISHLSTRSIRDILSGEEDFRTVNHVWSANDKLINLSQQYYNNPRYWHIIAASNKIGSEFDLKEGDIITIYFPLDRVLSFYGMI